MSDKLYYRKHRDEMTRNEMIGSIAGGILGSIPNRMLMRGNIDALIGVNSKKAKAAQFYMSGVDNMGKFIIKTLNNISPNIIKTLNKAPKAVKVPFNLLVPATVMVAPGVLGAIAGAEIGGHLGGKMDKTASDLGFTKEGKAKILKNLKGVKEVEKGIGEALNSFKTSYKSLTPQEKDTLTLSLGGLGMGGLIGYGMGKKADTVFIKLSAKKDDGIGLGSAILMGAVPAAALGAIAGVQQARAFGKLFHIPPKSLEQLELNMKAGLVGSGVNSVAGAAVGGSVYGVSRMLSKKAELAVEKLAEHSWNNAGGEFAGVLGGATLGMNAAEKLLAHAKHAPSKGLRSAFLAAGAVAGMYPGKVMGKHVGEGIDELLNTGKYRDRGNYKKKK